MWYTRYCKLLFLCPVLLAFLGCEPQTIKDASPLSPKDTASTRQARSIPTPADTSELERYLLEKGLVDVQSLNPGIRVSLLYATDRNFLHKPMYLGLTRCYLPCEVAIKLCNAEYYLNQANPQYHIIVFDAVRPLHIQKQMWDELDMPPAKKINYLANPADISLHNYGAAVDVGIIDEQDSLLDMGTAFDSFHELSQPKFEQRFLKEGKLSKLAYQNRLILRNVMLRARFSMMYTEWWHFNATNKVTAAARYGLIE